MKFDVTLTREISGKFMIQVGSPTEDLLTIHTEFDKVAIKIYEAFLEFIKVLETLKEEDKS